MYVYIIIADKIETALYIEKKDLRIIIRIEI